MRRRRPLSASNRTQRPTGHSSIREIGYAARRVCRPLVWGRRGPSPVDSFADGSPFRGDVASLPFQRRTQPEGESCRRSHQAETAGPTRGRVLVAEDETLIRLDIRAVLEKKGWDVCGEARDGSEAVRLVRGLEPDVALLDLRMPGIDGVEATRRIHGAREHADRDDDRLRPPELAGRDRSSRVPTEYVVKPFVEDELDRAIARAAGGSGPLGRRGRQGRGPRSSVRGAEIVAAAKRLFASNGYDATTIQEIADEVGMLKGSLYYHIAGKEDLLTMTVVGFLSASAAVLRHAQESGGSPRRGCSVSSPPACAPPLRLAGIGDRGRLLTVAAGGGRASCRHGCRDDGCAVPRATCSWRARGTVVPAQRRAVARRRAHPRHRGGLARDGGAEPQRARDRRRCARVRGVRPRGRERRRACS